MTPAYAILPRETIAAVHELCPRIRLFIVLRNPIERAWSAALMGLNRCQIEEHEASDQWFIDNFFSQQSRQRGDYLACIRRWQSVFAAQQLLILFTEDIAVQPRSVLQSLANHLAIEPGPFERLSDAQIHARVVPDLGVGCSDRRRLQLRPSLFAVLHELYGSSIDQLAVALGRDLRHWHRPPQCEDFPKAHVVATGSASLSTYLSLRQTLRTPPMTVAAPSAMPLDV